MNLFSTGEPNSFNQKSEILIIMMNERIERPMWHVKTDNMGSKRRKIRNLQNLTDSIQSLIAIMGIDIMSLPLTCYFFQKICNCHVEMAIIKIDNDERDDPQRHDMISHRRFTKMIISSQNQKLSKNVYLTINEKHWNIENPWILKLNFQLAFQRK